MVRSLVLVLAGAFLVVSAQAELQLTPKISRYEADGVKLELLAFSDGGGKEITYSPPRGWEYSGSPTKFTLRPPGKPQAEGTIARISLDQPALFDDPTMKKLAAEVLASVPGGSTNVTVVSQEKNALLIAQKETFLVIISYDFYGQNYQRSTMFLNRGNEQLRFQFVSRAADFKNLQMAFQASQLTWRNL
jgi:hypothetical protein